MPTPLIDAPNTALDAQLERLVGPSSKAGGSFFSVTWQTQPWEPFLQQVASLAPEQFSIMKEKIGRRMIRRLPIASQVDETVQEFSAGNGVLAIVDLLDRYLAYSSSRQELERIGGAGGAEIYMQLLGGTLAARGIGERVDRGRAAYFLPNGLPDIDEQDRAHIFADRFVRTYYEKALQLGRWPRNFDWAALLFPADRAIQVGAFGWAKLLCGLSCLFLLAAIVPFAAPAKTIQMVLSSIIVVAVRLTFPCFVARLAVLQAVEREMKSDRLGRIGIPERMINTVFSMHGNQTGEKNVAAEPFMMSTVNGSTGAGVRAANFKRYRRFIRFADFMVWLVIVAAAYIGFAH